MRHELPKQILTGALAVGLTVCLGCGPKDEEDGGSSAAAGQSPTEIAQSCLEMCMQGRTAEAVEKYADLDAIASSVFADEFDQLSDEKKETVRQGLVRLFEAVVAISPLASPEEPSLGELSTSETEDGLTRVSCDVTLSNGELQQSRLFFDQIDGRWRIVDIGNDHGSLTIGLRLACEAVESLAGDTPPNGMSPDEIIEQVLALVELTPMAIEVGGE